MLIGLVEDGRPVLGVVHGPAVGVTYAACGPGTATRQYRGGRPEPIHASAPSDGLVVVHSRSHENSRRLAEFLQDYPVRERKKCGSALKFGVIAAGEADLYPRFGTTMEWDTAAGQAVLEAAGGRVDNPHRRPPLLRQAGPQKRRLHRLGPPRLSRPATTDPARDAIIKAGSDAVGSISAVGNGYIRARSRMAPRSCPRFSFVASIRRNLPLPGALAKNRRCRQSRAG